MQATTILTADILDILFEGRNKEYGAYQLRKQYDRRISIALGSVCLLTALLVLFSYTHARGDERTLRVMTIDTNTTLTDLPDETPAPPPAPPKPPVELKEIKTRAFTTFKMVEAVNEEDRPPAMEELDHVRVGKTTIEGRLSDEVINPPVETTGKGIIDIPEKKEEETIFYRVEIESEFPGGIAAWTRYLIKTLRYPQEASDAGVQGTVIIQFIVDREGNVSQAEAVSGPEELREEALRVIRKSGKWTPAIQNGRAVKSYKKQPIVFRMEES